MNSQGIITRLPEAICPLRFSTVEQGLEWVRTGKIPAGAPSPCVVEGESAKPNPAYVDAPYEVAVWTPQTGFYIDDDPPKFEKSFDATKWRAIVEDVTSENRPTV